MYDFARTRSILFQCEPHQSYEDVIANKMLTNQCGNPTAAFLFFQSFQFIVA
jgi:hypothetical protein